MTIEIIGEDYGTLTLRELLQHPSDLVRRNAHSIKAYYEKRAKLAKLGLQD